MPRIPNAINTAAILSTPVHPRQSAFRSFIALPITQQSVPFVQYLENARVLMRQYTLRS
jgi:hypothetical protein